MATFSKLDYFKLFMAADRVFKLASQPKLGHMEKVELRQLAGQLTEMVEGAIGPMPRDPRMPRQNSQSSQSSEKKEPSQ